MKYTNTYIKENTYTRVLITNPEDVAFIKEMLIDSEDITLLGNVHVKPNGYAWTKNKAVAHLVCNHESNNMTYIDHINGNRLDNRKANLREIPAADNANNRTKANNNTGIVGIAKRVNGNYSYYRATVTDRSTPVISGKTKSACKKYTKQFNINNLGDAVAFNQAKEWLYTKRKEFGYV